MRNLAPIAPMALVASTLTGCALDPAVEQQQEPLASASRVDWIVQLGTAGLDAMDSVASDGDVVFAVGRIADGELGGTDVFVQEVTPDGNLAWSQNLGTSAFDGWAKVAATEDSLFVAGSTYGTVAGAVSAGSADVFMTRIDRATGATTTRQFGTAGFDFVLAVEADGEHVYLLGSTTGELPGQQLLGSGDLFLGKLTHDGEAVWLRQFGTPELDPAVYSVGGLVVDETGIYVATSLVSPGLAESNAFVARFDHDGGRVWAESFGTDCTDILAAVDLYDGHLYVTGATYGNLDDPHDPMCAQPPAGKRDYHSFGQAFVQKRTVDGALVWSRVLTAPALDDGGGRSLGIGIAASSKGVMVARELMQTAAAHPFDPDCSTAPLSEDFNVVALDLEGTLMWSESVGTRSSDAPNDIAIDRHGNAYVSGRTPCAMPGQTHAGLVDAALVRFSAP